MIYESMYRIRDIHFLLEIVEYFRVLCYNFYNNMQNLVSPMLPAVLHLRPHENAPNPIRETANVQN